jgi:hypothetical protein
MMMIIIIKHELPVKLRGTLGGRAPRTGRSSFGFYLPTFREPAPINNITTVIISPPRYSHSVRACGCVTDTAAATCRAPTRSARRGVRVPEIVLDPFRCPHIPARVRVPPQYASSFSPVPRIIARTLVPLRGYITLRRVHHIYV